MNVTLKVFQNMIFVSQIITSKIENMKIKKQWEFLLFRPKLPEGWSCLEQTESVRSSSTSFTRWGLSHHNGELKRFFVVFTEFNLDHPSNTDTGYSYTVRGCNDTKPNPQLRYFNTLKDCENYMLYLMESTDRWIEEITSPEYIDEYNKKLEILKAKIEKKPDIEE